LGLTDGELLLIHSTKIQVKNNNRKRTRRKRSCYVPRVSLLRAFTLPVKVGLVHKTPLLFTVNKIGRVQMLLGEEKGCNLSANLSLPVITKLWPYQYEYIFSLIQ